MESEGLEKKLENLEVSEQKSELAQSVDEWLKNTYNMDEFEKLVEGINSEDLFAQHYGVIGIRKLLAVSKTSLI